MHGQQSEERQQQQHMWSPPSQRSSVGNTADPAYKGLSKGGRDYNIGDCALFKAGNAPPFIGILRKVTVETIENQEQAKLSVNWLYRPADVKLGKGVLLEAAPNEIFYSFHKDDISAATLLHPCKVTFLRKGVELPAGVSSFVCRRVYDTANKCLWWLTDRDYTNEHQEEVDQLLDRTKLEMQAAVQSGGPSPRIFSVPTTSQQLKGTGENVQNGSCCASGKGKKRERTDQNLDPSKREQNVKFDDADASPLKRERSMKPEEILSNLDKDGGLLNVAGVDQLVKLMQQDQNDGTRKVADVAARRTMLAGVIAGTEKEECLNWFVQLGGLRLLDEWLQEAHKGKVGDAGSPKEGDKVVEELLLALLRALDRLPVDLEALKTCIVGKSVNHLRSHKNLDIQKKARKLVDVWKKRVDSEMKSSGDLKSGGGHGISWSFKQSSSDLVHSLSMKGSGGGPPEVAVKSSGAFAGNAKAAPNGSNSGDNTAKPVGILGAKAGSPTVSALRDNNSKLFVGSAANEMPCNLVKEEKSSSSSHSPSNGHSWGSGAGKSGTVTWKEEVKNSTAFLGTASCKNPGAGGSRVPNVHNKGLLGASLSGGSKEVVSGKPLVWSRNAVSEKAACPVGGSEKTNVEPISSQQRLIVRIPNPGRSPARTSGGTGDAPVSQSSSPSLLERQLSTSLADVSEKTRPEVGCPPNCSSEGADGRTLNEGKLGPSLSDEKTKHQEGEKMGDDTSGHRKLGDSKSECGPKEADVSHLGSDSIPSYPDRGLVDGSAQGDDVGKKDSNTLSAAGAEQGGPARHSQPSPMEVDEGAMGLLATVAAAAEESARGSAPGTDERAERSSVREFKADNESAVRTSTDAGPTHGNVNTGQTDMEMDGADHCGDHSEPGVSQNPANTGMPSIQTSRDGKSDQKEQHVGGDRVWQGPASLVGTKRQLESAPEEQRAGGERGETRSNLREEVGANGEVPSRSPNTLKLLEGQSVEDRRSDDVNAKLTSERSFPKDYKVIGRNGLESKLSGFDGHLSGRFGKREAGSDDRNSSRSHSKLSKSAIELCNSIGAGGDYRSSFGELRMQEEKDGKKRGQEVGQPFGRGESDCHRLADLVSGFPEEDVLEVARQAANEVEQMEKYGKPASSSSSERDGQESRPFGMANGCEPREASVPDTSGREHRRISAAREQPKDSGSDARDQQHTAGSHGGAHLDDIKETVIDRLDEAAKAVKATNSGEGEEVEQAPIAERTFDSKSSSLRGQHADVVTEAAKDELKRVGNGGPLSRASSFQPTQAEGSNVLSPSASQPVVKPTTPQQAAESSGPSDAAVRGSDGSERPDFDLNEGFAAEDGPQDDAATPSPVSMAPVSAPAHPLASAASASGVAAPIAVLAATKGAFIPPASPMRPRGELGWKGSAATSAFRPAEPRRTPDRQNSNAESIASDANLALTGNVPKRSRPLLEFDLNVADEIVMEDAGVAATTLSSQGSVLGMSLYNHSLPSSSVSGITFIKQETASLTFLKPESSSSAHPLSNGGNGPTRASHGAPSSSRHGAVRPNLDLDLNRMDEIEESGPPFPTDLRVSLEGVGSSARSNKSTTPPPRRVMDFDLNDGPSFEEAGGDEPALQPLFSRKLPPGNNGGPPPMALAGLRMGGETMTLSPWFSGPTNAFPAVAALPPFPSGRALDSGYSVAAAAGAHSFLNTSASPASTGSPYHGEIFRAGPAPSSSPAIVYPPPDRMPFGGAYAPFPVFGNSTGFLPSSAPFSVTSAPFGDAPGPLPFAANSSQLLSSATMTSSYARPSYLMGMTEVGPPPENNGGPWSRLSLDLNAGPEPADTDGVREDAMHGRLPPLHPGVQVFNEQMRAASNNTGLVPPVKRKEPEGGWNFYTGVGGYKQATWR